MTSATPSLAELQRRIAAQQRRAVDRIQHSIGLVLDAMHRRHAARALAWRQALCTKTACRRAGGCRGGGFGRACGRALSAGR